MTRRIFTFYNLCPCGHTKSRDRKKWPVYMDKRIRKQAGHMHPLRSHSTCTGQRWVQTSTHMQFAAPHHCLRCHTRYTCNCSPCCKFAVQHQNWHWEILVSKSCSKIKCPGAHSRSMHLQTQRLGPPGRNLNSWPEFLPSSSCSSAPLVCLELGERGTGVSPKQGILLCTKPLVRGVCSDKKQQYKFVPLLFLL